MQTQRTCKGSLFPDFSEVRNNRPCRGEVFAATVQSVGIGNQGRTLEFDEDA